MTIRERPIIFSGPMIPPIMDGRKTQTRRVIKPQPGCGPGYQPVNVLLCPYSQVGDLLWVRETWAYITDPFAISVGIRYRTDGAEQFFGSDNPKLIPNGRTVYNHCSKNYPDCVRYRPSIHMPRWASRITLEITDVRVERVQEITAAEAEAEGFVSTSYKDAPKGSIGFPAQVAVARIAIGQFAGYWKILHGAGSWDANPWVWAISFRRIKP